MFILTLDKQVAGGADGPRLVCGSAGEAAAVFSESLTDHQLGVSVLKANLEINRALDLIVLSEPHDDGGGVTTDLALQGHRLAFCHIRVLQALQKNTWLEKVTDIILCFGDDVIHLQTPVWAGPRHHLRLVRLLLPSPVESKMCYYTTCY